MLLILCCHKICAQSYDTIQKINGQKFEIVTNEVTEDTILLTVKKNSKIILLKKLDSSDINSIEFLDFNKDKRTDIIISHIGNVMTYSLFLFDKLKSNLKEVRGFEQFPDAVQLKTNSRYYYSYHRAGCADDDWASDLFKIEAFNTIWVAHISGNGCDEIESERTIEVYKVKNDNIENNALQTFKMGKVIKKLEDKWDFIKKYWNKNYAKFI